MRSSKDICVPLHDAAPCIVVPGDVVSSYGSAAIWSRWAVSGNTTVWEVVPPPEIECICTTCVHAWQNACLHEPSSTSSLQDTLLLLNCLKPVPDKTPNRFDELGIALHRRLPPCLIPYILTQGAVH